MTRSPTTLHDKRRSSGPERSARASDAPYSMTVRRTLCCSTGGIQRLVIHRYHSTSKHLRIGRMTAQTRSDSALPSFQCIYRVSPVFNWNRVCISTPHFWSRLPHAMVASRCVVPGHSPRRSSRAMTRILVTCTFGILANIGRAFHAGFTPIELRPFPIPQIRPGRSEPRDFCAHAVSLRSLPRTELTEVHSRRGKA